MLLKFHKQLTVCIITVLLGCGTEGEANQPYEPSGAAPTADEILIEFVSLEENRDPHFAAYLVTNKSDKKFWYRGGGTGIPLYDQQGLDSDGEWQSLIGWCGTGLGVVVIKPQESFEIRETPLSDEYDIVRIGLGFSSNNRLEGRVKIFSADVRK